MDRVTFLLERTGERIPCLLNPETIRMTRRAGVRRRQSSGGGLTGRSQSDHPLLYTGGGTTELQLDLLFDVTLGGGTLATDNVRDLTSPLWHLAENSVSEDGLGSLAVVRFVWGRVWNIPGIVAEVAERFEQFTSEGAPQRSWMRMRFVRVDVPEQEPPRPALNPEALAELTAQLESNRPAADSSVAHEILGGGQESVDSNEPSGETEKLYNLAYEAGWHPSYWRLLAGFNHIDDPLRLTAGKILQLPTAEIAPPPVIP
jgi:hypothetical protein